MPAIAIVNQSTVLKDAEIVPAVQALQVQLSRDLQKFWNASAWLTFVGLNRPIPPGCWQLLIKDTSDVEGALGYHTETPDGLPIGYVFAKTDLDASSSWTVTLSHELIELRVDPWTTFAAAGTVNGKPVFRALEPGDPCEDDSFGYDIGGVLVSDFVTPKYFEDQSKAGPFDFGGHVTKPGELLINGYQSIFQDGQWSDIQAEHSPNYVAPFPGSRRWLRQIRQK
jgi:hypothetical protein